MQATTIRVLFENVRTTIMPLIRRWRLRRIGEDVQYLFESLAAAVERHPEGAEEVIDVLVPLGALLEAKAPLASAVIDPVLDALTELHRALTDSMPLVATNIADMTEEEREELAAAYAAEHARQAAGLPPTDVDGHDCAICAVLARQSARRAS